MTDPSSVWSDLGYDPDLLRDKYHAEREKRLHAQGSAQYRPVTDELSTFLADPYTPRIERAPVTDHVEVTVIGGGFGGLLVGSRLRQAGVEDLRMVELGGDFGGTWYWNRYPGAACDVESYIYLPLLEETGYVPTEKYAKAPEIWAHCQRIARHFDLYRKALLQTTVSEIGWSDEDELWYICTDRGDRFSSSYVCMTTGAFTRPKLPGVPGIESYQGHSFHTTRWDYEYTGGDGAGGLVGLADKRVGIIGTGATSIQCVPHLARSVEQLFVFQRTPSVVDARDNRPTDPEWAASLRPGWQRERQENFSTVVSGAPIEVDLVNDGWTSVIRKLRNSTVGVAAESMERADYEKMEEIRERVATLVEDADVAEALKPYYRFLCKRPCFHDEYLQAFNRPNVTLVDTDGRGVERITERGIVANGTEYDLDCIIYASGFDASDLKDRLGYDVYGRDGLSLSAKWKDGISTFFGMQTHDFPNFFVVSMAQVGVASNQAHPLDVQSRHIAYIIDHARTHGASMVEATEDAEQRWVRACIEGSTASLDFLGSCTPGYYNNEGRPDLESFRRNGPYSPGIMAFSRLLDEWREQGELIGLEFVSR